MNLAEAKQLLSGRLVFGDETQIAARKFLERVEEAADAIRACNACMATHGEIKRHSCTKEFKEDVRGAAIAKINDAG